MSLKKCFLLHPDFHMVLHGFSACRWASGWVEKRSRKSIYRLINEIQIWNSRHQSFICVAFIFLAPTRRTQTNKLNWLGADLFKFGIEQHPIGRWKRSSSRCCCFFLSFTFCSPSSPNLLVIFVSFSHFMEVYMGRVLVAKPYTGKLN